MTFDDRVTQFAQALALTSSVVVRTPAARSLLLSPDQANRLEREWPQAREAAALHQLRVEFTRRADLTEHTTLDTALDAPRVTSYGSVAAHLYITAVEGPRRCQQ